jgi:hypothetical protein
MAKGEKERESPLGIVRAAAGREVRVIVKGGGSNALPPVSPLQNVWIILDGVFYVSRLRTLRPQSRHVKRSIEIPRNDRSGVGPKNV